MDIVHLTILHGEYMEMDKLFKEILEITVDTICEEYSVDSVKAQRLLVIALDENECDIFRSIEAALRNEIWFATAPERVLANKRLQSDQNPPRENSAAE